MLKRLTLLATLAAMTACGSSSSTPAAPSPAAPVYPNLVAAWSGTASIGVLSNGAAVGTNTCQTTWIIASESNGQLGGTFTLSGGTVTPCVQSASFSGTVSTTGAVSLTLSNQGAAVTGCTFLSNTPMAGIASGNSLTMQQTNHYSCGAVAADQIVNVTLTRN